MTKRRNLSKAGFYASVLLIGANLGSIEAVAQDVDALAQEAREAGQNEVVIAMGGGTYFKVLDELFFTPFTETTGIEVVHVGGGYSERIARLRAMSEADAVEWDIVATPADQITTPGVSSLLVDLGDCSGLPNIGANGLDGSCLGSGALWDAGGLVLTYDKRVFPDGGPKTWADFWDVERFPGPRALPNYGSPWYVLSAALIADGVSPGELYPLDLDRAFKKLDELRPDIGVWWTSGDQSQQLLRSQEVVASMLWNGRAARLGDEGTPTALSWDGAIFEAVALGLVKGGPNPKAAQALLNFLYTRPEAHAAFARKMHYALPHKEAVDHMDTEFAETLVSAPGNWPKTVKTDSNWVAQHRDDVIERWTAWISR